MSRKFLIEFMVEADEAVENSERLSKALGGVGNQVSTSSTRMLQAQSAITQVGSSVTTAAAQSTKGVTQMGTSATVLSGQLNSLLTKQQGTQEAGEKMSKSTTETGESFGALAHRSLFLFKALLGVEHIFAAIEKGSPIHAIMGLFLIFVKMDHFLGGHKRHLHSVEKGMHALSQTTQAGNSIADLAAKRLREQAVSLLASSRMTTDAAEAQKFLNLATQAAVEADKLEQTATAATVVAKTAKIATVDHEIKSVKKLTLVQRISQRIDKLGLKNLFSRNKQGKTNRAGLLRDLVLQKKGTKMSVGQMKVMADLGDKLGVTAQGAKYAEKNVGGVLGEVATGGKAAAGGMEAVAGEGGIAAEAMGGAGISVGAFAAVMIPLIAALPLLVFGFKVLHEALHPIGQAFKMVFGIVGEFAKLVAYPLMLAMHGVAEVVQELIIPFQELIGELYPVMQALGESLEEPLKEIAALMGPFIREVIAAAGGFEAFLGPVKELTAALKPLMPIIGEAIKETLIKMKPAITDFVKMLVELFKIMIGMIQPVMEVFISFLEEVPEMFEAIVGAAQIFVMVLKILLMVFKAMLPVIKFTIKVMMFGWKLVNIAVKFLVGLMKLLEKGFEYITDAAISFFAYLSPAIDFVSHLFEKFKDILNSIGDVAKKVGSFFFGSGLWGLPEAIAEVKPAMKGFQDQLDDISDSAKGIGSMKMPGMQSASLTGAAPASRASISAPTEIGATAATPLFTRAASVSGSSAGEDSPSRGRAPGAQSGTVKVSIPITLQMDGLVLARAMHEQVISIGRDRWMNSPLDPLRGVEGA